MSEHSLVLVLFSDWLIKIGNSSIASRKVFKVNVQCSMIPPSELISVLFADEGCHV